MGAINDFNALNLHHSYFGSVDAGRYYFKFKRQFDDNTTLSDYIDLDFMNSIIQDQTSASQHGTLQMLDLIRKR